MKYSKTGLSDELPRLPQAHLFVVLYSEIVDIISFGPVHFLLTLCNGPFRARDTSPYSAVAGDIPQFTVSARNTQHLLVELESDYFSCVCALIKL